MEGARGDEKYRDEFRERVRQEVMRSTAVQDGMRKEKSEREREEVTGKGTDRGGGRARKVLERD